MKLSKFDSSHSLREDDKKSWIKYSKKSLWIKKALILSSRTF